jgi:hypothetical protein
MPKVITVDEFSIALQDPKQAKKTLKALKTAQIETREKIRLMRHNLPRLA